MGYDSDMAEDMMYNEEYIEAMEGPDCDISRNYNLKGEKIMKKDFFIAGVQFRPSKGIVKGMEQGATLTLVPEPENKYDSNAIKVMYGPEHLGYVPAKFAAEVGASMEIYGDSLQCILTTYEPKAKTWERLGVTVGISKEDFLSQTLSDLEDPNA